MKKKNSTLLLTREEARQQLQWVVLDAAGKTLGRLASEITKILRGKHKVNFTPHVDCGDGVIVINAKDIEVSGAKEAQKVYTHHTGAVGGLREIPYRVMKERKPEYIIRRAVLGMMPKTRLGGQQVRKLRIYAKDQHDLAAQKPVVAQI